MLARRYTMSLPYGLQFAATQHARLLRQLSDAAIVMAAYLLSPHQGGLGLPRRSPFSDTAWIAPLLSPLSITEAFDGVDLKTSALIYQASAGINIIVDERHEAFFASYDGHFRLYSSI